MPRLVIVVAIMLAIGSFSAVAETVVVNASGFGTNVFVLNFPSGPFVSEFTYSTDTSLAEFKSETPNDVSYLFSGLEFTATASIGAVNYNLTQIEVGIADNFVVNAGDFPGLPAGVYDAFGLASYLPGATLSPTGGITDGTIISLLFYGPTNIFNGVSTIPSAPPLAGVSAFFLGATISGGSATGVAVGHLNSVSSAIVIPVPGAFLLVLSGFGCLIGVRSRGRVVCDSGVAIPRTPRMFARNLI